CLRESRPTEYQSVRQAPCRDQTVPWGRGYGNSLINANGNPRIAQLSPGFSVRRTMNPPKCDLWATGPPSGPLRPGKKEAGWSPKRRRPGHPFRKKFKKNVLTP